MLSLQSQNSSVHRTGLAASSHRYATPRLVEQAIPDGNTVSATLIRLLDVKDTAHWGPRLVDRRTATQAVRWAARVIERATDEAER